LANDGNIYAIPSDEVQILKIDPRSDTTALVGDTILEGNHKWYGGVLARDGNIYGIPFNHTSILRFDPETQTTILIACRTQYAFSQECWWRGGVVTENGTIYGIPYSAPRVLKYEPPRGYTTGGIDDSPHGPDRLGHQLIADALVATAKKVESPNASLCVGLYAPWGSGKTFLWRLIKKTLQKKAATSSDPKSGGAPTSKWTAVMRCLLPITFGELCFLLMTKSTNAGRRNRSSNQSLAYLPSFSDSSERRARRQQQCELYEIVAVKFVLLLLLLLVLSPVMLLLAPFRNCIRRTVIDEENGDSESIEGHANEVWKVLTGETCVGNGQRWPPSPSGVVRSLFLTCIQKASLGISSVLRTSMSSLAILGDMLFCSCCFPPPTEFTTSDQATIKYAIVEFNAWVYSGSEFLWASLIEELWTTVEKSVGKHQVRFHRASIELSGEDSNDSIEVKRQKRQQALWNYHLNWYISAILGLVGTTITVIIVTFPSVQNLLRDTTILITGFAIQTLTLIPFGSQIYTVVKKVWPELRKSRGKRILEEAESYQRTDFGEKTGFMGEVRKEVDYLFDFLKTYHTDEGECLRLAVFVDDLDRCPKEITMKVLQAVILLLVDAPVTCWLAIDSRIVAASVEEYFGETFAQAGISGLEFLDKIVNLPFCIPGMDDDKKSNYCERLSLGEVLTVQGVYMRMRQHKLFLDLGLRLRPPEELGSEPEMLLEIVNMFGNPNFTGISIPVGHLSHLMAEFRKEPNNTESQEELLASLWLFMKDTAAHPRRASGASIAQSDQLSSSTAADENTDGRPENIASGTSTSDPGSGPNPEPTNNEDGITGASDANLTHARVLNANLTHARVLIHARVLSTSQPMLNDKERTWFSANARFVSGNPRTIKRILNVFNVGRYIADHTGNFGGEFSIKLLKFIVLLEQWPYRMAWLLQLAEDVLQSERAVPVTATAIQQGDESSRETNMGNADQTNSFKRPGTTLATLCYKLHKQQHKQQIDPAEYKHCIKTMYEELALYHVYDRLVQSLMYSLEGVDLLLRRDGDPQQFEIFLNEEPVLALSDLEYPHLDWRIKNENQGRNLRNYAFNLPRSMLERVSTYEGSHFLGIKHNNDNSTWHPVFTKKNAVYDLSMHGDITWINES